MAFDYNTYLMHQQSGGGYHAGGGAAGGDFLKGTAFEKVLFFGLGGTGLPDQQGFLSKNILDLGSKNKKPGVLGIFNGLVTRAPTSTHSEHVGQIGGGGTAEMGGGIQAGGGTAEMMGGSQSGGDTLGLGDMSSFISGGSTVSSIGEISAPGPTPGFNMPSQGMAYSDM